MGGNVAAPFREGFDPPVSASHHVESPVPLSTRIEVGVFAVGDGLTGADQHGNLALVSAMDTQRPLQQPDTSVQHDGLQFPGDSRIAHGHGHGQGLVPSIDVAGSVGLVDFLPGQGFPYRRPVGAGGRDYVFDVQIPKGL